MLNKKIKTYDEVQQEIKTQLENNQKFIDHVLTLAREDKYNEIREFFDAQSTRSARLLIDSAFDSQAWRLLHHAADSGDCGLISILINEYNAYPSFRNEDRYTPLMLAAVQGFTEICKILVDAEIHSIKRTIKFNNADIKKKGGTND